MLAITKLPLKAGCLEKHFNLAKKIYQMSTEYVEPDASLIFTVDSEHKKEGCAIQFKTSDSVSEECGHDLFQYSSVRPSSRNIF